MDSVGLVLLLLLGLAWAYVLRMRQRLRQYQDKIRQLKMRQQNIADGEQLDGLLASMNEAVFRLSYSGQVIAANQHAQTLFAMQGSELPLSLRQIYRDSDWHDALHAALAALPKPSVLPDFHIANQVLSPRLAILNAEELLLMCVDVGEQRRLETQRRTFLSNLMHDLKTPLTSLLGYARSLERFGDDADFRQEAATVIADEAKHVNHLLDALLTLDQIEFSTADAEAHCEAVAVINQVCEMLKPQCEQKQLSLSIDVTDMELILAMSADNAERIISNVLVNAINHSPEQGCIAVMLKRAEQHCCIMIQDEGLGIPAADLARVTERFYRVDQARTRKDGGHGLGLAIVKELVEKHAGDLKLSNREPQGLQVEVILPLLKA
ncbi:MAG: GHKL domain-containing protein [Mariprofundus sp.]|nr:GHKL domain-containing protein [Mariprofundus sp.]